MVLTVFGKMQFKITTALICALAMAACSRSDKPQPEVAKVPPAVSPEYSLDVDLEIANIFGDLPVGGFLPKSIKWAPDSSAFAYIRTVPATGDNFKELWIHEIKGHRERPILSGPDLPVDEYDWCGNEKFAIISGGDLYTVNLDGVVARLTETESNESSLRCAPDGTKLAFARDHNVVAIDFVKQTEWPVTTGGNITKPFGEVSWVYGEEFRVKDGFGWSLDSNHIWFYAFDSTDVRKRTIVTSSSGEVREQYYPSPGEYNPRVRIGIASANPQNTNITTLKTGAQEDIYIPKILPIPGGKELLVARLDRLQTILDLLKCDSSSGDCTVIASERDPHWINFRAPKIIRDGKEFLWLLERDGFFHIHRFDMNGRHLDQLTQGRWVVASIDGVEEKEGLVYFQANLDEQTDYGLYAVDVSNKNIKQISEEPGVHKAEFSPDLNYYVDTHSALDRPPRKELFKRSGESVATISAHDLRQYTLPRVTTDFMPLKTKDGETLYGRLTRPRALDPDQKYPVLVYVYGGPGAQVVKNEFRTKYNPWMYLLARRGILVFSVDGRGTFGRGHEFETAIHRRLGEIELKDQLEGIAYLKSLPFVDPKRIGIFGWSYGGTMVLNALFRTEGVFKAGISVAPVTDWRWYDTAYTERFMQRPMDNPEGYKDTSLLSAASNLDAPLLLVHGLSDDNVHFINSALLIDELVKSGKHFDLMVYPGKDHGMSSDSDTLSHLFSAISNFLMRHL